MGDVEAPSTTPSRADLRRAQVLEAAGKCFNLEGFQGASMASIAAAASMSVGQIYRYFANKEAVIAALVAENLETWNGRMAEVRAHSDDIVDQMIEVARYHAEKVGEPERAALSLEFLAEAARNPKIAEIVRTVDTAMRGHLKRLLLDAGAQGGEELERRLDMIATLIDGWVIRAVKNPSIRMQDYLDSLRPLFEILLHCHGEDCDEACES